MNALVSMVVTISIGIVVGTAADYWMLDKFVKYALMAVVITLSLRLLRRSKI